MLYRLNTNIFIIGLLTIGFLAVMIAERAFSAMAIALILAFISQMSILLFFSNERKVFYTEKTLFWTTMLYGVAIGAVFMTISYYYEGDTFMFSKGDAMLYFTESIKVVKAGLMSQMAYLLGEYEFEDLGAFTFDSVLLYLIPNKLFINGVYMLTGALSSILLFRMGKHFMSESYAFMASLVYSTSSYLIFFHCSFLKESIFVFLVICAMYFFYKAVADESYWSYIWTILFLGLIVFFRPAVSGMLAIAFIAYFAITQRGSATSFFLYVIIAFLFVAFLATIKSMTDRYTGGDIEAMKERGAVESYSSSFSYLVSLVAGPFGPFPTLFPKEIGDPQPLNFYGAGLTYRLFLIIPFWMGVYYAAKSRNVLMLPMLTFILAEMMASAIVLASLELRKVLLHIPFMSIVTFYGLYQWKDSEVSDSFRKLTESMWYVMTIGVLLVWNVIR